MSDNSSSAPCVHALLTASTIKLLMMSGIQSRVHCTAELIFAYLLLIACARNQTGMLVVSMLEPFYRTKGEIRIPPSIATLNFLWHTSTCCGTKVF